VIHDWAVVLSAQSTPTTPNGCHFKMRLGPHVSQMAYVQSGSVTADTTGSIKASTFTVTICAQSDNLVPVTSTWNTKRFTF
jgi:hypothetical protein